MEQGDGNLSRGGSAAAEVRETSSRGGRPPSSPPINSLCDDALALVLSYADFSSAVSFSAGVSRHWRGRCGMGEEGHLDGDGDGDPGDGGGTPLRRMWREMFDRQLFSPESIVTAPCSSPSCCSSSSSCCRTLVEECGLRRRYLETLFSSGRQQRQRQRLPGSVDDAGFEQNAAAAALSVAFVPLLPPDHRDGACGGGDEKCGGGDGNNRGHEGDDAMTLTSVTATMMSDSLLWNESAGTIRGSFFHESDATLRIDGLALALEEEERQALALEEEERQGEGETEGKIQEQQQSSAAELSLDDTDGTGETEPRGNVNKSINNNGSSLLGWSNDDDLSTGAGDGVLEGGRLDQNASAAAAAASAPGDNQDLDCPHEAAAGSDRSREGVRYGSFASGAWNGGGGGGGGEEEEDFDDDEDGPPMVDFDCDSFLLSSTGASPELVLLDPFTGELRIHPTVSAVSHNDGRNSNNRNKIVKGCKGGGGATAAATANTTKVLFGAEEASAPVRPCEYFSVTDVAAADSSQSDGNDDEEDESFDIMDVGIGGGGGGDNHHHHRPQDRVDVSYVGIDAKPVLLRRQRQIGGNDDSESNKFRVAGSMLAMGRCLSREPPEPWEEGLRCVELLSWFRPCGEDGEQEGGGGGDYGDRHVCRFSGAFHCIDTCPINRHLFVNQMITIPFDGEDGGGGAEHDHRNAFRDDANEQEEVAGGGGEEDGGGVNVGGGGGGGGMLNTDLLFMGQSVITAYPFIPYPREMPGHKSNDEDLPRFFPQPTFEVNCRQSVSTFSVDPTGTTMLVGTANGCVQVWNIDAGCYYSAASGAAGKSSVTSAAVSSSAAATQPSPVPSPSRADVAASTAATASPRRTQNINVSAAVRDSVRRSSERRSPPPPSSRTPGVAPTEGRGGVVVDDDDATAASANAADATGSAAPIQSFHFPRHLPIETCGFVSLQHGSGEDSSILLWRRRERQQQPVVGPGPHAGTDERRRGCGAAKKIEENDKEGRWEVQSVVNLPLSSQRCPRVHYDGRRLVVFGEDDMGLVILVYQILHSCNEEEELVLPDENDDDDDGIGDDDVASSSSSNSPAAPAEDVVGTQTAAEEAAEDEGIIAPGGGVGGGVRNIVSPSRIRFRNAIRHPALDGLDFFDSMHMSCNERFIVVNTKAGDRIGSPAAATSASASTPRTSSRGKPPSPPYYTDGLFVIDLDGRG